MSAKRSKAVAFGGMTAALALVIMLLAGVLPTASYALAGLAGILTVPIFIEFGYGVSLSVFAGVALLSMLLLPQKEPALLFICFLCWYPIAKSPLEKIPSRAVEYVAKFVVFNLTVVAFYELATRLLLSEADFEGSFMQKYGIWVLWAMSNLAFLLYDIALSRLITYYNLRLRGRVHKTFFS